MANNYCIPSALKTWRTAIPLYPFCSKWRPATPLYPFCSRSLGMQASNAFNATSCPSQSIWSLLWVSPEKLCLLSFSSTWKDRIGSSILANRHDTLVHNGWIESGFQLDPRPGCRTYFSGWWSSEQSSTLDWQRIQLLQEVIRLDHLWDWFESWNKLANNVSGPVPLTFHPSQLFSNMQPKLRRPGLQCRPYLKAILKSEFFQCSCFCQSTSEYDVCSLLTENQTQYCRRSNYCT